MTENREIAIKERPAMTGASRRLGWALVHPSWEPSRRVLGNRW